MEQMGECRTSVNICGGGTESTPRLFGISQAVRIEEKTENMHFEVKLERFRILSWLAIGVLGVPITIVA
ncbi:hypothetical protein GQ457_12G018050 [Hibiscus cannabinus]